LSRNFSTNTSGGGAEAKNATNWFQSDFTDATTLLAPSQNKTKRRECWRNLSRVSFHNAFVSPSISPRTLVYGSYCCCAAYTIRNTQTALNWNADAHTCTYVFITVVTGVSHRLLLCVYYTASLFISANVTALCVALRGSPTKGVSWPYVFGRRCSARGRQAYSAEYASPAAVVNICVVSTPTTCASDRSAGEAET